MDRGPILVPLFLAFNHAATAAGSIYRRSKRNTLPCQRILRSSMTTISCVSNIKLTNLFKHNGAFTSFTTETKPKVLDNFLFAANGLKRLDTSL